MLIYAVLSLTVIRMVPVLLSLLGTGMSVSSKLFIGWFGPRGLASIVFGVSVFDAGVPGRETIVVTVVLTVLLSIIAHGATANPLITTLSNRRSVTRYALRSLVSNANAKSTPGVTARPPLDEGS
jgi:NhaP-type Na+/H+ or K+/H+ antiporter